MVFVALLLIIFNAKFAVREEKVHIKNVCLLGDSKAAGRRSTTRARQYF